MLTEYTCARDEAIPAALSTAARSNVFVLILFFYCVLFRVWCQFLRAASLCQRFFEQNFSLFCRAISHFRQVRKSSPYSRRFCLIFGNFPPSDVIEPDCISSDRHGWTGAKMCPLYF